MVKVVAPVNVTQLLSAPENRSWMYDLGNNYAGVPRVALPSGVTAGHTLTIAVTEYPAGKKTRLFCAIFILNMIVLPRQARDKHGES